jgi:fructose-specific phosphotransferase system IIA component
MKIVDLLDESTVVAGLEASSKKDVLNQLIDRFTDEVSPEQLEKIRNAVFERESIMSTGVGKGLAIPHGKCEGVERNLAAFALLDKPVDYDAIDGQAVQMVFLLVGPEHQSSTHIKLLSRISRMMNNAEFREELKACDSTEAILETFKSADQS